MEALQSDAARKGARILDDPSMRLADRPKQGGSGSADHDAAQRRRGRAFEDLGSTFAPKSKQRRAPPSADLAKSLTKGTAGRRSTTTHAGRSEPSGRSTRGLGAAASIIVSNGSSDSSEDELDCLSQPPSSPKKARKENRIKQDAAVVDGKAYPYHPKFRPESSSVIQTLKFKKISKTAKGDDGASDQPGKSVAFDNSHGSKENVAGCSSATPIFVDFHQASQSSSSSSVALSESSTLKDGSPSRKSRAPLASSKPNDSTRPRPRPVRHTKSPTRPPSPEIPLPNCDKTLSPTPKRKQHHDSNSDSKTPAPFPAMPPLSSRMDFPAPSPLSQKVENAPKTKHLPFPLSPPQSKSSSSSEPRNVAPSARKKGETRVKRKTKGKRKGKQRSDLGSDSDVVVGEASTSGLKAQPFPMSTQMLNSIDDFSPPRPIGLSSKKRSSEEPDDDWGRKKSRKSDELYIGSIMHHDDDAYEEEDTITIASMTDPSRLCPFCDAPLPPEPTPHLTRLIQSMIRSSLPDPRPGNPLGRKAPFSRYIVICQRHLFETTILPRARAQGWPQAIDWTRLGTRVERMKDALRALIDDKHVAHLQTQPHPRAACVFWKEVMEEVRKMGVRVATGSHGQMDSFKKTLPGYYGELGSVIIHQTLYNMFPLTSFNSESIAPLTANEFVQRILVPEVALRLVMEDKGLHGACGRDAALEIMRQSADYGAQMFPEDGAAGHGGDGWPGGNGGDNEDDGGDALGAGDAIVMERARKRRKELEEEEKMEQEREMRAEKLRREEEEEEARLKRCRGKEPALGAKMNAKPKSSLKSKGKGKAGEDEDGASDVLMQARPKPRPVARHAKSAREVSNGTDDEEEEHGDEDNEMVGRIPTLDVADHESDMNDMRLDASVYEMDDRLKVKKRVSSRKAPAPRGDTSSSESERSPPSSGDEYGGPTRVAKSCASRPPSKKDKHKHQPAPRLTSTPRAQARRMEADEADVVVATSPRASTRAGRRKKRDKDKQSPEVSDDEDEAPEPPTSSVSHSSPSGVAAGKGKALPPLFAAQNRKITGSSPRKSAPSESAEWKWLLDY